MQLVGLHNYVRARVCNPRYSRLYITADGHICVFRMCYKNYSIIYVITCTTYSSFFHVRSANQPIIQGVALCNKRGWRIKQRWKTVCMYVCMQCSLVALCVSGLAKFNPQKTYEIGNDSLEGRTCVYICRKKVVKVKVKFTLEQSTKDQRGSRFIALLFL